MVDHGPRFVALVEEARRRVRELSAEEVKAKLDRGESFMLIDVREESEWASERLPKAVHMGKGVLERDIEAAVPDTAAEIVLFCRGGYRSVLSADSLKKMGYTNVCSMIGGVRGWLAAGYPVVR
ncbi:MAG: sulfurtransferase [Deltaproteobacteria bacterium]|nr:sulfurtransferase [Deltaproteobacteria bacterium]